MTNSRILVDTNILIYAYDTSESDKHPKAIEVFVKYGKQIGISTQTLSEFAAVMMKKQVDHEWLAQTITRLNRLIPTYPLTSESIVQAIHATHQYRMHYWDAQIWAVAKLNGINKIFSEDGPTGQKIGGIDYYNPFLTRD